MLARECKKELTEHIIPFWNSLEDDDNGGFYGYVGNDLTLDKNAPKGVILHSRILWFYSNCYLVLKDQNCLKKAKHAYEFLSKYCVDKENGGVYWMMNADGTVNDSMKHKIAV
mgnify:FL=1